MEISLLLPANWASALVALSQRREQSVGQLLRGLIDRALTDDGTIYKVSEELTEGCARN